jgi:MFS family permease
VLATLCLTQIFSWGVLFYAFPVASPEIAEQTRWSPSSIAGGFSLGLLTAAGAGIGVGRLLDRRGPHLVMTAGSVTATAAIVVVAMAPNLTTFIAGWLLAGLAQAAVLYPPAFAALTRWYGPARVRALTTLTLVAGLASTVFAPVTAALLDQLGWRNTYLVLGAGLAVVTIPAHALGLRAPWPTVQTDPPLGGPSATTSSTSVTPIVRSRTFLMLARAMTITAFTFGAATISLVPLLTEHGWSGTAAAWALGLTGLAQLMGRVGYPSLTRRTQPHTRTLVVPFLAAAPLAVLASSAHLATVLVSCIVLGVTRGGFTLVESTAVADRWGTRHFGALYGLVSAPAIVGVALSPWVGAALADRAGGYPQLFGLLAALTLVAASLALGTKASQAPPTPRA